MAKPIPFVKANALGNDFVLIEEAATSAGECGALARAICDRHAGVGADGMMVVSRAVEGAAARVRTYNSDGSEAELSGNGLRVVAAWLAGESSIGQQIVLETRAGGRAFTLVARDDWRFTFDSAMGLPIFDPEKIPFRPERAISIPVVGYPFEFAGRTWPATILSMGNPQCVIFVQEFERTDWRGLGRWLERHACFPERVNVAFVANGGAGQIVARFWERGAGETLSSGTGACAAAVATILSGVSRREIFVQMPGGEMRVHWPEGDQIYLTGSAQLVARGEFLVPAAPAGS